MKSKLLVFEGIDGSGKTTQIQLLEKYLQEKNITFEIISFPRYEDNTYGKLIRKYLNGEMGELKKIDPYLIAPSYAGDRLLAKPLIENWLNEGKLVIANRYISSSKAHLGANLVEEKREEFMRWLDQLEYQTNGIPRSDLNILLNVDPKTGHINVQGGQKDIHEDNLNHLEEASKIYLELSKGEDNWKVVDCMEGAKMKDKEAIHKSVVEILGPYLLS